MVVNAVFSKMALSISKEKSDRAAFLKKISWFGDIRENISKLAQTQTLWYLVGWLVGNTVFSETALRIFLIFCMKLGDYKGRKVTAGLLKKSLDLKIFTKTSPN